jgi:hypothetical protein
MAKNEYDYEDYFDEMDRFRQPKNWRIIELSIIILIVIYLLVKC